MRRCRGRGGQRTKPTCPTPPSPLPAAQPSAFAPAAAAACAHSPPIASHTASRWPAWCSLWPLGQCCGWSAALLLHPSLGKTVLRHHLRAPASPGRGRWLKPEQPLVRCSAAPLALLRAPGGPPCRPAGRGMQWWGGRLGWGGAQQQRRAATMCSAPTATHCPLHPGAASDHRCSSKGVWLIIDVSCRHQHGGNSPVISSADHPLCCFYDRLRSI